MSYTYLEQLFSRNFTQLFNSEVFSSRHMTKLVLDEVLDGEVPLRISFSKLRDILFIPDLAVNKVCRGVGKSF